jgi:flagellar hook-basal body complex protein FliE
MFNKGEQLSSPFLFGGYMYAELSFAEKLGKILGRVDHEFEVLSKNAKRSLEGASEDIERVMAEIKKARTAERKRKTKELLKKECPL